jgi:hypothetical protein
MLILMRQYSKTKYPTAMKNPNLLRKEEFQAKKAVCKIQLWVEKNYPGLATAAKTKMILECLIELTEERKMVSVLR